MANPRLPLNANPQEVVRAVLRCDPTSGDLFDFRNARGDRLQILAWMGDGFALHLRRLERGTFAFPTTNTSDLTVTSTQLAMLLGGPYPVAKLRAGRVQCNRWRAA